MPTTTTLAIWMNGERVGEWTQTRGTDILQYDPAWLASPAARALSLSLPLPPGNTPHKGPAVANYFDNLLPDSDAIRARIRSRFATASTRPFELLSAIGRDCVGAVQLLPEATPPASHDRIDSEPLADRDVENLIAASLSPGRILGQSTADATADDFRISIAGAQEKTALLHHRGKWRRPLGSTPTTHILKLPLGLVGHLQMDMQHSIENEWLCMKLMQAYGLPSANCDIAHFGSRKVLVVDRFDRRLQPGGWIARLPQEDFCQALGLPSSQKYEADGGPGMIDILRVLDASAQPAADKRAFLKAQIIFWLLAATDGHAKNFSLKHERGGVFRLAPFYDVLSAWPVIGKRANQIDWRKAKLAMSVRGKNAHWKLSEIKPRHWHPAVRAAGLADATELLDEIAAQTPSAIAEAHRQAPKNFPQDVLEKILEGATRVAGQLA
jgi:serine/threonine-protein kinase HipA